MPTRKELIASGVEITPLTREEILLQGGEIEPLNVKERVLQGVVGGGGITPEGTITITENGTGIDVAQYATADVSVPASAVVSGTKSITENGTGIDVTDYASVDVAVPATPETPTVELVIQNNTSVQLSYTIPARYMWPISGIETPLFYSEGYLSAGQSRIFYVSKAVRSASLKGTANFVATFGSSSKLPSGKKVSITLSSGSKTLYTSNNSGDSYYFEAVSVTSLQNEGIITFDLIDE